MANPRRRITDPHFRYRPSFATDVRETFRRARVRAGVEAARARRVDEKRADTVVPLKKAATGGSR